MLTSNTVALPHEANEIDWKARLSDKKERLAEHLMAFANHANGGTLAFGVNNAGVPVGIDASAVAEITNLKFRRLRSQCGGARYLIF